MILMQYGFDGGKKLSFQMKRKINTLIYYRPVDIIYLQKWREKTPQISGNSRKTFHQTKSNRKVVRVHFNSIKTCNWLI